MNILAGIVNVENLKRELKERELNVKSTKERLYAAEKILMASLEAGGTTGDWLRDECIKMYGHEPATEAAYRDVNDSFKGHKGEFVLLTYDIEKRLPGGFLREESWHTVTYYRLGVLADDKLIVVLHKGWDKRRDSYHLEPPVESFIAGEKEPFPRIGKLEVIKQRLFDLEHQDRDPPHFMKYVGEKSGLHPEWGQSASIMRYPTNAQLVVGNEAVKEWLKKAAMQDLYKPAAHALGMLELEPTDAK